MSSLFACRGKCSAVLKYVMLAVFCVGLGGSAPVDADTKGGDDVAAAVICNVIVFVQKLGLPIMTGVILGSSIMAIFGKVSWPAIVMLVVFTGIFFGAGKLMQKFAKGLGTDVGTKADSFVCSGDGSTTLN